jgi:NitT/TauT family transport system permease protein
MAQAGVVTAPASPPMSRSRKVTLLRIGIVVGVLVLWEAVAASGLLYQDVVPSLTKIGRELVDLLTSATFYFHVGVTGSEIALALIIGGLSGLVVGLVLGGSPLLGRAFEPYLYYLGPTPKIIFFPVLIMWFGVGPASKTAMGALSCFFPVALSAAAGMREIDRVLIRVGKSFRTPLWHMVTKIYLPAMRAPIVNGFRLGLGVAIIGTLLAETKLSNRGVGFLVIQSYSRFDMPNMYALLLVVFLLAIGANEIVTRLAHSDPSRRARKLDL